MCLAAVALHLLNRFVLEPLSGDPGDFFHCYADDVLCLPLALPLLLWLLRRLGLRADDRPPTIAEIALLWALWSWFCEVVAPNLPQLYAHAVGDPLDVAAYAAGGAAAALLWRSPLRPRFCDGAGATLGVLIAVLCAHVLLFVQLPPATTR